MSTLRGSVLKIVHTDGPEKARLRRYGYQLTFSLASCLEESTRTSGWP
jgi:hypothetical protein